MLQRNLPRVYTQRKGVLFALLFALTNVLRGFEEDYQLALAETSILTATGFWLDFWGYFFRTRRFPAEGDNDFRRRIRRTIINGHNTRKAVLEAVRPYSVVEPELIEYNPEVIIEDDYSGYSYETEFNRNAFIMLLTYRPQTLNDKNFFVGKSFIGVNTYLFNPLRTRQSAQRIEEITNEVKMGGVKLIFKAH